MIVFAFDKRLKVFLLKSFLLIGLVILFYMINSFNLVNVKYAFVIPKHVDCVPHNVFFLLGHEGGLLRVLLVQSWFFSNLNGVKAQTLFKEGVMIVTVVFLDEVFVGRKVFFYELLRVARFLFGHLQIPIF